MGIEPIFNSENWAAVPFHFWTLVFFVGGSIVGSFLNVCIHRMPLDQSLISPPSHCPHCRYAIPWYLNIPLVTWLYLRGRCRHCAAPIAARYFWVELLTAALFAGVWLCYGRLSAWQAVVYAILIAGLIVATFIDFEHYIIPDEIPLGGAAVGFVASFLLPALHGQKSPANGMRESLIGVAVGAGVIYGILRLGKWVFGRQKVKLEGETRVIFSETAVILPQQTIPYEELFYRQSDTIRLKARTVELVDRGYPEVMVRLSPEKLHIGEDEFDPATVPHLEAQASELVLPREAMGLGDVKFMAAIGAFLGWQAVIFSLMLSSMLGAVVGVGAIALGRREWSSRMPYGPYIAMATVVWMFGGRELVSRWWAGSL